MSEPLNVGCNKRQYQQIPHSNKDLSPPHHINNNSNHRILQHCSPFNDQNFNANNNNIASSQQDKDLYNDSQVTPETIYSVNKNSHQIFDLNCLHHHYLQKKQQGSSEKIKPNNQQRNDQYHDNDRDENIVCAQTPNKNMQKIKHPEITFMTAKEQQKKQLCSLSTQHHHYQHLYPQFKQIDSKKQTKVITAHAKKTKMLANLRKSLSMSPENSNIDKTAAHVQKEKANQRQRQKSGINSRKDSASEVPKQSEENSSGTNQAQNQTSELPNIKNNKSPPSSKNSERPIIGHITAHQIHVTKFQQTAKKLTEMKIKQEKLLISNAIKIHNERKSKRGETVSSISKSMAVQNQQSESHVQENYSDEKKTQQIDSNNLKTPQKHPQRQQVLKSVFDNYRDNLLQKRQKEQGSGSGSGSGSGVSSNKHKKRSVIKLKTEPTATPQRETTSPNLIQIQSPSPTFEETIPKRQDQQSSFRLKSVLINTPVVVDSRNTRKKCSTGNNSSNYQGHNGHNYYYSPHDKQIYHQDQNNQEKSSLIPKPQLSLMKTKQKSLQNLMRNLSNSQIHNSSNHHHNKLSEDTKPTTEKWISPFSKQKHHSINKSRSRLYTQPIQEQHILQQQQQQPYLEPRSRKIVSFEIKKKLSQSHVHQTENHTDQQKSGIQKNNKLQEGSHEPQSGLYGRKNEPKDILSYHISNYHVAKAKGKNIYENKDSLSQQKQKYQRSFSNNNNKNIFLPTTKQKIKVYNNYKKNTEQQCHQSFGYSQHLVENQQQSPKRWGSKRSLEKELEYLLQGEQKEYQKMCLLGDQKQQGFKSNDDRLQSSSKNVQFPFQNQRISNSIGLRNPADEICSKKVRKRRQQLGFLNLKTEAQQSHHRYNQQILNSNSILSLPKNYNHNYYKRPLKKSQLQTQNQKIQGWSHEHELNDEKKMSYEMTFYQVSKDGYSFKNTANKIRQLYAQNQQQQ